MRGGARRENLSSENKCDLLPKHSGAPHAHAGFQQDTILLAVAGNAFSDVAGLNLANVILWGSTEADRYSTVL